MSEPLSGSGTAAALGGATVYGLFTGTDFGIVFGAFAGALFVATMPQKISAWRVAAHFLVSFIVGVLGARVLSAWIASKTGYDGTSAEALCAVLVAVGLNLLFCVLVIRARGNVSKILSFRR